MTGQTLTFPPRPSCLCPAYAPRHVCVCVFRASASPSTLGEGGRLQRRCPPGVKDTDVTALITEAGSQRSWLSQPNSAGLNPDPNSHLHFPSCQVLFPNEAFSSGNAALTPHRSSKQTHNDPLPSEGEDQESKTSIETLLFTWPADFTLTWTLVSTVCWT